MIKIAFIGMMGSGKTTISKRLSKELNLKYFSVDEEIVKDKGMSINDIFASQGEAAFRLAETETLTKLTDSSDVVLDCGGGIVLNPINVALLKSKGFTIIFLDRTLEDILRTIDYTTRPLLKDDPDKIYKIYHERIEIYTEASDIVFDNTGWFNSKYEALKKLIQDMA